MNIGILGAGSVGTALSLAWRESGHHIRLGVRDLDLAGRIVIDATNPVSVRAGVLHREPTLAASAAEDVAAIAAGASVFKTLNQAGANILGGARSLRFRPLMFIAGDDSARKPAVRALVEDLGFDARDAGGLSSSAHLESLAWLWIHEALTGSQGRSFAFASLPAG